MIIVRRESRPKKIAAAKAELEREAREKAEPGRAVYKMREAIVEPVFGQIKERRDFRRFSLRGLRNVRCEWKLVCLASNLRKLFASGWAPQAT